MGTEDAIIIATSNIVKTLDEGKKSYNISRFRESIQYYMSQNF